MDNKEIFVSYRREGTTSYAVSLAERLANHFGKQNVFFDTRAIEPGTDWVERIERALESCAVMLVVIGKSWMALLTEREQTGEPDIQRFEVSTALNRDDVRVIPVLVDGASMPRASESPADLVDLTYLNAMKLHFHNWEPDAAFIIAELEKVLGSAEVADDTSIMEPFIPEQVSDYARTQIVSIPKDVLNETDATNGVQATYQTPYGAELRFDVQLYSSPDAAEKAKQQGLQRWKSAGSVDKKPFTIESAQGIQVGTGVPMVSRQGNELTTWTDGNMRVSTQAPAEQFGREFRQSLYSQHWAGRISSKRRRWW